MINTFSEFWLTALMIFENSIYILLISFGSDIEITFSHVCTDSIPPVNNKSFLNYFWAEKNI